MAEAWRSAGEPLFDYVDWYSSATWWAWSADV